MEEKIKGFQDRNFCILTFACKSRECPSCQNNDLKSESTVLIRYCTWENGQADVRVTCY